MPMDTAATSAIVYRMVMTDHMCPYGFTSKDLLERQGYQVDDRHLTSREEVDAFKVKHEVKTTPQTLIGDERVGGFDDLSAYLGKAVQTKDATTYKPVIALFSVAALMAGSLTWLSAPAALFVASIGAVSVFKAVYIDKRELKCACVGGDSKVPLGFVSLTENLMIVSMALWKLSKL